MAEPKKVSSQVNTHPRRRGFTLVELLVVIGIIALLISILLPALTRARMSASSLACQANLHSIGQGITMYVNDYKGSLPYGWWNGASPIPTANTGYDPNHENDWVTLTMQELNGKMVANANSTATDGSIVSRTRGMFLCPDAPGQGTNTGDHSSVSHYASHPRLMMSYDGQTPYNGTTASAILPYKLSRVQRSTDIALIMDASVFNRTAAQTLNGLQDPGDVWTQWNTIPVLKNMDASSLYTAGSSTNYNLLSTSPTYNAGQMVVIKTGTLNPQAVTNRDNQTKYAWNIRFRHMKNTVANALMCDGHVQSFHYNPSTYVTDLVERNICVNP